MEVDVVCTGCSQQRVTAARRAAGCRCANDPRVHTRWHVLVGGRIRRIIVNNDFVRCIVATHKGRQALAQEIAFVVVGDEQCQRRRHYLSMMCLSRTACKPRPNTSTESNTNPVPSTSPPSRPKPTPTARLITAATRQRPLSKRKSLSGL